MARDCPSRRALLHGLRPGSQQRSVCGVCPGHCIYCDIWKLACLIFTHTPFSLRQSSRSLTHSSRSSSPTHRETYEWETSERLLEAQFAQQRARLASIMSIATVDGAEQSEGLRIAHDRCLGNVQQLLYQEKVLEQTIVRSGQSAQEQRHRQPSMPRRTSNCGAAYPYRERRPSRIGVAM